MIKKYADNAAYEAAGVPTEESRVALIADTNEVRIDGVNVLVPVPGDGDAVFIDEDGNDRFVRYDTIQKDLIPEGWTHVGYAFGQRGKTYKVLDKSFPTATFQWVGAWQHAITAISDAAIKFWLKMKGNYATFVGIEVTLSDSSNDYMNATTVAEINTALEAAGNTGNVGYANHGWWAYLADSNYEASENGTKIVVQCDFDGDYSQNATSDATHALVGCTMEHVTYRDMPASSAVFHRTMASAGSSPMNLEKAVAYNTTSGATPSANVAINSTTIVKKASFDESEYCADLRAFFGTYEAYIAANMVKYPHPNYGAFAMIDADEMTRRYANLTFTKKDGVTTGYIFPALHTATSVGYGSGKYAQGRWHLSDITDGVEYMDDVTMAKIAAAQTRMNTTLLTNTVYRWFARRVSAITAWVFYSTFGSLSYITVNGATRCQAVSFCRLD